MIFGGYVKVRVFYTHIIIWVNTSPKHIGIKTYLPTFESSCTVYGPNDNKNKNTVKCPNHTSIKKIRNPRDGNPNDIDVL